VPVVTRAAGFVTLMDSQGATHELVSTEPLNAAAMVVTGRGGWATVELAGAGHVSIGPYAALTVARANGKLYVMPARGPACVQGEPEQIAVRVFGVDVTPARTSAVFEVVASAERAEAAVVGGAIGLSGRGTWLPVNGGHAIVIVKTGAMHGAPMPNLAVKWPGWHCPD
jgi:hypothetical protein